MNPSFTRYSPERRTALVLCGTGAHGAYHAGVLRALEEAGVKIDVMAGQGVGAVAATLGAIGSGSRLWDPDGVWRSSQARTFYGWTRAVRVTMRILAALAVAALIVPPALALAGFSAWSGWVWVPPALVAAGLLAVAWGSGLFGTGGASRRRTVGRPWWRLLGAPVDAEQARHAWASALWQLIRSAGHSGPPSNEAIGRRYAEVLTENLGQPGFRELVLVATDLDARRDLVAGLVAEPFRRDFLAGQAERSRADDVVDLSGAGATHAFDVVAAALTPAVACEPYPLTFTVDSYWRGETHRMCDRPGSCTRLLEEVAAAGVSQVLVVSAVAAPSEPHRLTPPGLELRRRLGEFLSASEAAALNDALDVARLRFDAVHVIRPAHNAVGPFDTAGVYDEASDRRQDLVELMQRAYDDAYRQFIEPVVGASGDQLGQVEMT